jgi:hypothetical protein
MGCGVRMRCNHCELFDEDMLIRRNGLGFATCRDIMGLVPALRKYTLNIGVSNREQ